MTEPESNSFPDLPTIVWFARGRESWRSEFVFNEFTLGGALRKLAANGTEAEMREALQALARSLDHETKVKLEIVNKNKGNPSHVWHKMPRYLSILDTCFNEYDVSGQFEAAIAKAREKHGVSRATVYKALKMTAFMFSNVTLDSFSKSELATLGDGERERLAKLVNWLNRYLDEPPADAG